MKSSRNLITAALLGNEQAERCEARKANARQPVKIDLPADDNEESNRKLV